MERQVSSLRPLDELMIGYTGKLAAKYVVEYCPTSLKWALGGRSLVRLTALADDIQKLNSDRNAVGIVVADSDDFEALVALAKSTKVVVSFAGPFAKYIPHLFADETGRNSLS